VLLVAATWAVLGCTGVEAFAIFREHVFRSRPRAEQGQNISDSFHDGKELPEAFITWIDHLFNNVKTFDTMTPSILDFVRTLLKGNPKERPNSAKALKEYQKITAEAIRQSTRKRRSIRKRKANPAGLSILQQMTQESTDGFVWSFSTHFNADAGATSTSMALQIPDNRTIPSSSRPKRLSIGSKILSANSKRLSASSIASSAYGKDVPLDRTNTNSSRHSIHAVQDSHSSASSSRVQHKRIDELSSLHLKFKAFDSSSNQPIETASKEETHRLDTSPRISQKAIEHSSTSGSDSMDSNPISNRAKVRRMFKPSQKDPRQDSTIKTFEDIPYPILRLSLSHNKPGESRWVTLAKRFRRKDQDLTINDSFAYIPELRRRKHVSISRFLPLL
jgi:hypothetical protein